MARIHELLKQVSDPALRARLEEEVERLTKNKKFGLVFEEHIPECTPLYDVPIKRGATVARNAPGKLNDVYRVLQLEGDVAVCCKNDGTVETIALNELIAVAQFGDPIYPYLQPIDSVCNAPDSGLWHTLIEADNYHALQLLEYLYAGKVDCIYIDPPYNTGAKDWKYNNDYVDSSDNYRHSKWLSMMKKRLELAKRILNPKTGVLICTIDEHEVHHLRTLLENIFPESYIQMATIVINRKGVAQGRLARVEEYAIYVFMSDAFIPAYFDDYLTQTEISAEISKPRWERLLRGGNNSLREDRPKMFYPVRIDPVKKKIIGAGEILPLDELPDMSDVESKTVAWPIRKDGSLGNWQLQPSTFTELLEQGYVKLGSYDNKRKTWTILYLNRGTRKRINDGEIIITGRDEITGTVSIEFANPEAKMFNIKTVWNKKTHDSGVYGSTLLSTIVGRSVKFDFPKSVYSTKDAIAAVVRNNPSALIVDFFAGSGTTLNSINLLNMEDDGHRRCILVTNNECSEDDAKKLTSEGYAPGNAFWESKGICRSVTWPRTKYSITGHRDDGTILEGEYFTTDVCEKEKSRNFSQISFIDKPTEMKSAQKKQLLSLCAKGILPQNLVKEDTKFVVSENEKHTASILFDDSAADEWLEMLEGMDHITDFYIITDKKAKFTKIKNSLIDLLGPIIIQEQAKRPMSDGFAANCEYFKLSFLDKDRVSLGLQFREILPLLWLKAGAKGKRPEIDGEDIPEMLVLPDNGFAVLTEETAYASFAEQLAESGGIDTVFFVTNSEAAFREMSEGVEVQNTFQLYRDYLENFKIGARRAAQ